MWLPGLCGARRVLTRPFSGPSVRSAGSQRGRCLSVTLASARRRPRVLSLASCVSASGLGPLPGGRARTCRLHGALGRSRRCSSSRWQAPCSRPPAHASARAWSVCGTGGQASTPQRLLSPGLLLSLFVSSPIVHTFSPVRKDRVEVSGGLTCRVVMDPMLGRCDDWKGLNRDPVTFYLFGF